MRDRIRAILEYGVAIGVVDPRNIEWMVASCPDPGTARNYVAKTRRYLASLASVGS